MGARMKTSSKRIPPFTRRAALPFAFAAVLVAAVGATAAVRGGLRRRSGAAVAGQAVGPFRFGEQVRNRARMALRLCLQTNWFGK
jgi:hypothetical protein